MYPKVNEAGPDGRREFGMCLDCRHLNRIGRLSCGATGWSVMRDGRDDGCDLYFQPEGAGQ